MRYIFCALFVVASLAAQDVSLQPAPAATNGAFYVDGIVYEYAAGHDFTVVTAAHSVMNHKFVAVKVRVYNSGQQSVTVKPQDIVLQDAVAGRPVDSVKAEDLVKRVRRPYNWARYAVNPVVGNGGGGAPDDETVMTTEMVQMMRAMAAKANASGNRSVVTGRNLLYTDTPGALHPGEGAPALNTCDEVCQLRSVETEGPDPLKHLEHETQPDDIQQSAFLANTIPPRSNASGLVFCPLGKLAEGHVEGMASKKGRMVHVTATVAGESFEFTLPVE